MSLVVEAWNGISNQPFKYRTLLNYSGRFRDYNGNIMLKDGLVTVNLSKKWKDVGVDIQLGIMQDLLCRLFKKKVRTMNMDLYDAFLRNAHMIVEKKHTDPVLEASFIRINEKFFANTLEQPNLKWSTGSTKLGWYHFGSDTVAISRVLEPDLDLLDYVMYHELLHKFHKFKTSGSKNYYHTKQFRLDEKKYPNAELLEKRLSNRLRLISKL